MSIQTIWQLHPAQITELLELCNKTDTVYLRHFLICIFIKCLYCCLKAKQMGDVLVVGVHSDGKLLC